jgi:hypothetical protein
VAHKIYDNFSPATRPDLTVQKEQAVLTIARQVLLRHGLDPLIRRSVDDTSLLWDRFGAHLFDLGSRPSRDWQQAAREAVQSAFLQCRVASDPAVALWLRAAAQVIDGRGTVEDAFLESRAAEELHAEIESWHPRNRSKSRATTPSKELEDLDPVLYPADPSDPASLPGYSEQSYDDLARRLFELPGKLKKDAGKRNLRAGRIEWKEPVGTGFVVLMERVGAVARSLDARLLEIPIVRTIGVAEFRRQCGPKVDRALTLVLAAELEELINGQLGREFEDWIDSHATTPTPSDVQTFVEGRVSAVRENVQQRTEDAPPELLADVLRALMKCAAKVLRTSGEPGSSEDADVLAAMASVT